MNSIEWKCQIKSRPTVNQAFYDGFNNGFEKYEWMNLHRIQNEKDFNWKNTLALCHH